MPFKSEAQRRYMHANHPKIAQEWETHSSGGTQLPERVTTERKRTGVRKFTDAELTLRKALKSIEN